MKKILFNINRLMYIKYDNQYYKIDTLLSSSIYSLKDNFEKTHNIIINDIYYKNKKLDLENSFFIII